jgi:hypothetical protein
MDSRNALKAATEAAEREDFELAQAILDGAGISMPNGTLVRLGLPDGFFSYQNYQFVFILEGLGMENVGIFYEHLKYFPAVWYILW